MMIFAGWGLITKLKDIFVYPFFVLFHMEERLVNFLWRFLSVVVEEAVGRHEVELRIPKIVPA